MMARLDCIPMLMFEEFAWSALVLSCPSLGYILWVSSVWLIQFIGSLTNHLSVVWGAFDELHGKFLESLLIVLVSQVFVAEENGEVISSVVYVQDILAPNPFSMSSIWGCPYAKLMLMDGFRSAILCHACGFGFDNFGDFLLIQCVFASYDGPSAIIVSCSLHHTCKVIFCIFFFFLIFVLLIIVSGSPLIRAHGMSILLHVHGMTILSSSGG